MLWGCHVMPSLASALSALKNPRRGRKGREESALKTPPNPPSNPFPSDCRCSSRPSAQGCGPGSVSAEGEALGGGRGADCPQDKAMALFPQTNRGSSRLKNNNNKKNPSPQNPPESKTECAETSLARRAARRRFPTSETQEEPREKPRCSQPGTQLGSALPSPPAPRWLWVKAQQQNGITLRGAL